MGGEPVGALSLFLGREAVGIYNVEVAQARQRRGVGTALTLGAAIVWGLRLSNDTPWIFSGQQLLGGDGRVFAFTTASEWLGIVVVMGIATLIAAIALLPTIPGRSSSQPVASNS